MPAITPLRCGRSVFPTTPRFAVLRRAAQERCAATTSKPRKSRSSAASDIESVQLEIPLEKENKSKKPRPQVWASRLERETLGASSSVLILRDVESKKSGHKLSQDKEERTEQILNVNQILSSIAGQNVDPAQQEVNKSITSIRPENVFPAYGRAPCISLASFEGLVKALCDGFTQSQLARYITAFWEWQEKGSVTGSTSQLVDSMNKTVNQTKLTWQMLGTMEKGQKRRARELSSGGKREIANRIVRNVWGFEVQEEIEKEGLLRFQVDPKHLDLVVTGGNSSVLRELSMEKNIKIDVSRSDGIISLTSDKYKCLEAAESIQRLLRNVYTIDFDLSPFRTPPKTAQPSLFSTQLSPIAAKLQCAIEEDRVANKLIIRSRNKTTAEQCQRILTIAMLSHSLEPLESGILTTIADQPGNLFAVTNPVTSVARIRDARNFGRFSTTYELAGGREVPVKRSTDRKMLHDDITLEICSRLLQSHDSHGVEGDSEEAQSKSSDKSKLLSHWLPEPETQFLVETGHVLHEMQNRSITEHLSSSDLLDRAPATRSFSPVAFGLPHFLVSNFRNTEVKRNVSLRVSFILSPWASPSLLDGSRGPKLEMMFEGAPRSRNLELESLTATVEHHTVNVMLPQASMDLRFSRKEVFHSTNADRIPTVSQFVRHIQDSAVGYGKITPPMFLRLKVPKVAIKEEPKIHPKTTSDSDPNAAEVELEFMSTAIEYEESLSYNFKGQELVMRRVGGGEFTAKYDNLLMRYINPSTSTSTDRDAPTTGKEEPDPYPTTTLPRDELLAFVGHASSLIRELDLAFGNMSMMGTDPKFSDPRKVEQRKAAFKPKDYRTKGLWPRSRAVEEGS